MIVKFKRIHEDAKLPCKVHEHDVGYDLSSIEDVELPVGKVTKVRTGIVLASCEFGDAPLLREQKHAFPKIEGRSGLASKGIFPVGGIIDPGYRGELVAVLHNSSDEIFKVSKGDRIAQLVFYYVVRPAIRTSLEIVESDRGDSGFGSTGV
jgi:dUTP pyrophosphatase